MRPATLLLVMAALVVYYGHTQRVSGRAEGRGEVAGRFVKSWTKEVAKRDTVYRTTLRHFRTVDSLYDSVRVTDTVAVTLRDTVRVYIPRDVADSALNLCRLTVRTCDQRVAASDSLAASLRLQVKAVDARKPGLLGRWSERLLWLGAGYGLGKVGGR